MSPDVFKHLPHLDGKLTPLEQSEFRATPDKVEYWDGLARKMGHPPGWRLTDAEIEASRRAVLAGHERGRDLWIFGYGSLMWDPALHFEEVRLATLEGYRRCFSMQSRIGRGSTEKPALMLSLERGEGRCTGLAFRIAAHLADDETAVFWRREMITGSYRPVLLPATTPQGEIRSLVLAANPAHANYVGDLPLEESAAIIAAGVGMLGTNLKYLEQLVEKLEQLRIEDDYIRQLMDRVRLIRQNTLGSALSTG